jgi:DNA-binding NtrC family response regulator
MARILIAHHDMSQRMLFQNVLSREGHEVLCTSDYTTAMGIVQQEPVQLVFLSLWLSGITGVDLAHSLRTLDETLPLVVLLVYFDPRRNLLNALNVKSLMSPFDVKKIVTTTERYLRPMVLEP